MAFDHQTFSWGNFDVGTVEKNVDMPLIVMRKRGVGDVPRLGVTALCGAVAYICWRAAHDAAV